jgi:hypothetical protein
MAIGAVLSFAANFSFAQSASNPSSQTVLTARVEPPAEPLPATAPKAQQPASDATLQNSLSEQISVLNQRIDALQRQVDEARAAMLADTADTAALKQAERELNAAAAAARAPQPKKQDALEASAVAPLVLVPAQPQVTAPAPPPTPAPKDPHAPAFADWDWTWLNGNPRNKDVAFDSKFFTPEIRADITYNYDFNRPADDTMSGSSELFRTNEMQLEQLGLGGDFHLDNAHVRFMTQFGMYSTATVRNDPSYSKGQWNIADADRYLSEAYAGYQMPNVMHGLNVDAGIFMSYIGLFSYYNFDNWAYQPSFVSSNTPWFFEGIRIQLFPTAHLKIEPWIINGWQSYGSSGSRKGIGGQLKWTPYPWMNVISNNYGLGNDDLGVQGRERAHTDNSLEIKYYDKPKKTLDKMAFSFTGDMGCEFGNGVECHGGTLNSARGPKQSFIGYMIYNRMWFKNDRHGLTIGGGQINNPGRYLVLIPPINGESASSAAINSPYFTGNPGDSFKAWDGTITYDYMPRQWLTWRWEYGYRHANVPYWTGHGGMTPPTYLGATYGANNGSPTDFACMDGSAAATDLADSQAFCNANASTKYAGHGGVWFPDLRRDEQYIDIDLMVKF